MDRLDSRPQVSGMMTARKPYPSDVSDEEWALAVPYLTLLPETAGQPGLFGSGHERFVRAGRAAEGPAGCRSC